LSNNKLCNIVPAYGPKNFANWLIKLRKNEKQLDFSVLVCYDT
jgi:hypothetical protein